MGKLDNLSNNTEGFSTLEIVVAIFVFIILLSIAHLLLHHKPSKTPSSSTSNSVTNQTTTPTPAPRNPYSTLSLANVPSKTPECTAALTYGSNGDPQPVQCPNGDLNVTEWNALAALEPTVMTLGYGASEAQVQTAICNDANAADEDSSASSSNAIEVSVYQISALYYGWDFSSNPSVVLTNGSC